MAESLRVPGLLGPQRENLSQGKKERRKKERKIKRKSEKRRN
jgi:hypothetical protein